MKRTKEYRAEYMKEYFAKKKEKMGAVQYSLSRQKENTAKKREYCLSYYYKNREKILKYLKEKWKAERKAKLHKLIEFKKNYLNN